MTEDVFLSCTLTEACHSLLPWINQPRVRPFGHATSPQLYLPWCSNCTTLYSSIAHPPLNMVSLNLWVFMLNRTHDRTSKWRKENSRWMLKKVPSSYWFSRCRTSHCLISSAVVVFPIHALICTSHWPLGQFSRNRKWSTSHCSPCGTLLTTALCSNQHYKDITNNICVTDGDQLPFLKRNIDNREHLWSNVGLMWQLHGPTGHAGNALKWKGQMGEGVFEWCRRKGDGLIFGQFMDLA